MKRTNSQRMLSGYLGNPTTSKSISLEERYPGIKEKARELGSWQLAIEWYKRQRL
jgi:hypothetical protein